LSLIAPESVVATDASEIPAGKRVHFVSLGCPKNLVDAEVMLGTLAQDGFRVVDNPVDADVIVVNTCSFVAEAKEESIEAILDMADIKAKGGQKLVVSGCLAQRYVTELEEELPEVDLFIGTGEYRRIAELVSSDDAPRVAVERPCYVSDHEAPRVLTTPGYTSYVRIAEGCSQRCTFCIIPKIRGKARSRSIESVATEVAEFGAAGVKEINLIAQDLTHYGDDLKDPSVGLEQLLRKLVTIDDIQWFRLLYCYPHNFSEGLVDLIAGEEKICSYVDIPLQHVHDDMLRRMQRRTTERITRDLIGRLRQVPEMELRTTFIVGHPGETEEHFQRLYDFVEESRFDRVGVFQYSREENTKSAKQDQQVPDAVKEERFHRLMQLQNAISRERMQAMVGREIEVIVEGISEESDLLLQARHRGQAPEIDGITYLNEGTDGLAAGDIRRAEVVHHGDYDLVARVIS
jgi:ribosomal protein S12 methylthiotransferase